MANITGLCETGAFNVFGGVVPDAQAAMDTATRPNDSRLLL
jgi:hypothetical protein